MGKKERKIFRKILGPTKTPEGGYRLGSDQQLYEKTEIFSDIIRKRRLKFYGHVLRMDEGRLTKQIFNSNTKEKSVTNCSKPFDKARRKLDFLGKTRRKRRTERNSGN